MNKGLTCLERHEVRVINDWIFIFHLIIYKINKYKNKYM